MHCACSLCIVDFDVDLFAWLGILLSDIVNINLGSVLPKVYFDLSFVWGVFFKSYHLIQISLLSPRSLTHIDRFELDSGSGLPQQQTRVALCRTKQMLSIAFAANDSAIDSPYRQCNDPLYKYDAVEVFVALADTRRDPPPVHYVEIELNPYGAMFLAAIDNRSGNCSDFRGAQAACSTSGIQHSAATVPGGWTAQLSIPFDELVCFFWICNAFLTIF